MKKKFTLGTVIALVLITAILTFQVTFVLATGYAADKYSSGGSSESSGFINNVIKKLANDSPDEVKRAAAEQIYSLAILSQRQLTPEELKRFFDSSVKLIEKTL